MIERFVSAAHQEVERRRVEVPIAELERQSGSRGGRRPFREALTRPGLSVIAEFKRRSPSSGDIREDAQVAVITGAYEAGGAVALSVLTEGPHFGGSLADLRAARAATGLPVLRKDFTVDPYQLHEAAAHGADAVLLIVAALDDDALASLHRQARTLDLDCVVEVHDEGELERALSAGAELLGINNRNLDDLSVDLDTTFRLLDGIPAGRTVISESGISDRPTMEKLGRAGVDAVLVGEALMRAPDPSAKVRELVAAEAPDPDARSGAPGKGRVRQ